MNFSKLLSYWNLKDVVHYDSCITNDVVYGSDVRHVVYHMIVQGITLHANIIYKFEIKNGMKSKYAMVYADILFSGSSQSIRNGSQVFIKNAKITDLESYLR